MPEQEYKFKILYETLDELVEDRQGFPDVDELSQYNEIQELRDVVLNLRDIPQRYSTST